MRMTRLTSALLSTIVAVTAALVIAPGGSARADVVYQEDGGRVVGEGEIFSSRTMKVIGSVTNGWYAVPDELAGAGTLANARGGAYIQCLPDNSSAGAPNVPPEIHYQMRIFTPGTYRLYLRRDGNATSEGTAGSSDSMFMDIVELKDGTAGVFPSPTNAVADWYEAAGNVDGDFATVPWNTSVAAEVNAAGASGRSADWLIRSPGVYTLRFSQREDGAAVDSWIFQQSALAAPSGDGPAMSALEQTRFAVAPAADTFLRRDDVGAPYGTNTELVVKNDGAGVSNLDRTAYLRFDLAGLPLAAGCVVTNVSLHIDLINEGIGTNHTIYAAVIAEDAADETFDELTLTAAGSDVWNDATDEAVDFAKVFGGAPAASRVIAAADENKTVTFTGPGLVNALRADTDGVFALVLYRTDDNPGTDSFASKEHATRLAPRLEVGYWFPPPGTLITVF